MSTKKTTEAVEVNQENSFTKASILVSDKYANRRDILGVLLKDNEHYTTEQIDSLLENFMKGQVK